MDYHPACPSKARETGWLFEILGLKYEGQSNKISWVTDIQLHVQHAFHALGYKGYQVLVP